MEASDEIRKSLVSDAGELVARLRSFRSHAEAVAKVEKHVTTYPEKVKAFITAQFEELHKMLEKRKETLLKEVDTQYNGFSKTLWVEKDIVETSICKLEAGIKFAQQVAKSEDELEVAVLGSRAVASMRQMMKTLSWDPKAIKNLGPVGYAAQGSDEYQEFIKKIGILKNMEISISNKGYNGYQSYHDFTKNGTYCVEVEVNFGSDVEALFPQMSISCTCKTCTTKQKRGKWEVTFQTANPGSYTIMATLKISGEDYSETTRLHVVEPAIKEDFEALTFIEDGIIVEGCETAKPVFGYNAEAFPSSSSNGRRLYTSVYDSTEWQLSKPRTDHPRNDNFLPPVYYDRPKPGYSSEKIPHSYDTPSARPSKKLTSKKVVKY